jgi:DNA-binding XRE family transcriptional regulator
MPNIALALRDEMARIARREIKSQTAVLQRSSVKQRKEIARLKREITELTRALARTSKKKTPEPVSDDVSTKHRFVASGFRTLRHRLGLSAAQMGKLLDVSEQSIYNWETMVAVPRRAMLPRIAQLRGKGKREVAEMLG